MEAAHPWYYRKRDQPFDRKVVHVLALVFVTLLLVWLVQLLKTPILWLIIAMFVAIAASGPVNWLAKRMRRGFAIAIVYSLIVLLPIGLGAALLPPLVNSTVSLVNDMPAYISDFQDTLQKNEKFQKIDENFDVNKELSNFASSLSGKLGSAASALGSIGSALLSSIFAAFSIFILSMFMVARGRGWLDHLIRRREKREAEALDRTFDRIGGAVGGYIGGALLQAFLAGLVAFIVLTILGVTSPLVLAVIVAIFDVIPIVGSTIAGILVGIVTLFSGFPVDTIVWAVFVIAYQQLENYLIQPKIQGRAVEMEPFVILVAVLFGGTLMGVVGAVLAIPIAATLQITYQEINTFRDEVEAFEAAAESGDSDPAPAA